MFVNLHLPYHKSRHHKSSQLGFAPAGVCRGLDAATGGGRKIEPRRAGPLGVAGSSSGDGRPSGPVAGNVGEVAAPREGHRGARQRNRRHEAARWRTADRNGRLPRRQRQSRRFHPRHAPVHGWKDPAGLNNPCSSVFLTVVFILANQRKCSQSRAFLKKKSKICPLKRKHPFQLQEMLFGGKIQL